MGSGLAFCLRAQKARPDPAIPDPFVCLVCIMLHQAWKRPPKPWSVPDYSPIEVFYNRQRHHQTLGYQTPLHYEQTMGVA
jgi:hypothetical protein